VTGADLCCGQLICFTLVSF